MRAWPRKRRRMVLAAVLAIGALCFLLRLDPQLSVIGDNAEYVVIAESILAGHGLAHENDPALKPQTKYPPVYPALLTPLVAAFGTRTIPLKLFTIVCGMVALWLTFLLVETRAGTGMAAVVSLLVALNSHFMNYGQEVLAEVPYLAMTLAALWFLERDRRETATGTTPSTGTGADAFARIMTRSGLLALAFATLASNTRTVGLGLGIAVAIHELLARRPRRAAVWFGLFVALNLPWFIRNRLLGTAGTYAEQIMQINPYRPFLGTIGPGDFVTRVRENLEIYVGQVIPELFFAPAMGLAPESAGLLLVLGVILTGAVLTGLVVHLRRERSVLEIYTLFFLTTCLAWPQVWSSVRFLLPVLPLLVLYTLEGFRALGRWIAGRMPGFSSPRLGWGVMLALLGLQGVDAAKGLAAPRELLPDWVSYYAAADWVRSETPPSSIIVCRSAYLFYLRAHRKTVGYVFSEKPDEVLQSIFDQKATHVVVDNFRWTGTSMRYLVPALNSRREAFNPVHRTAPPETWVLAVREAPAGSDAGTPPGDHAP